MKHLPQLLPLSNNTFFLINWKKAVSRRLEMVFFCINGIDSCTNEIIGFSGIP